MRQRFSSIPFGVFLFAVISVGTALAGSAPGLPGPPLLIEEVTASRTEIVFSWSGQLWRVPRSGGEARRVTQGDQEEGFPRFSPNGQLLAYTAVFGGNEDVYVIPSEGGEPRRLTHHSKADRLRSWTPDSRGIVFMSGRDADSFSRLYHMSLDDPMPQPFDLQQGFDGVLSPDGKKLLYLPWAPTSRTWRYYRGGMVGPLWLLDLQSADYEVIADNRGINLDPMWIGDAIFFVSDRDGAKNLYRYDQGSRRTTRLTDYAYYGIDVAGAAPDAVVFLRDGRLSLFDIGLGRLIEVPVKVPLDSEELRPKTVPLERYIESLALSSNGESLFIGARGDVFGYNLVQQKAENLTTSSASAERFPTLSPDGLRLAYFTDLSGEYELELRSMDKGETRRFRLESQVGFYREPTWSPDSRRFAFSSQRLALSVIDLESGEVKEIDRSEYLAQDVFQPSWSPDSRWIAYAKALPTGIKTVFLAEVDSGRRVQVSDGKVDCRNPVFDKSGRAVFFSASTGAYKGAGNEIWGLQSSIENRPAISMTLAMALLRRDLPSPVFPYRATPNPEGRLEESGSTVRVDVEGIQGRVRGLPGSEIVIREMAAGGAGEIYLRTLKWPETPTTARNFETPLYRYRLEDPGKYELILDDVDEFQLTGNAGRVLYRARGKVRYRDLAGQASADGKDDPVISLSGNPISVDPAQEWRQMYREAWRMMRDYFYDPHHHGQDLKALESHYEAYLPGVCRRADLTALLRKALGNVSVSHLSIGGGDAPVKQAGSPERIGYLGADFEIDNGRYRFIRILRSAHLTAPSTLSQAPLDQPGIEVSSGDYLLEVDGRAITGDRNLHSQVMGLASQAVTIKVGPRPDGSDSREYRVMLTPGENTLRRSNWAIERAEMVDRLSDGQLSYVYIGGYNFDFYKEFDRAFGGGRDSRGMIIDQRYNGGGITSDSMIEALERETIYYYDFRYGNDLRVPMYSIHGPKVLIAHQFNGSAAETFPHMFKLRRVGTIVGMPTLGGGIGGALYTQALIDGGSIRIPNRAAYDPRNGTWGIENEGVQPDIVVDVLPKDWRAGRDPQLEKAVQVALEQLKTYPPLVKTKPQPPVHPGDPKERN